MSYVRTDVHEVGDTLTALSLGIALEEFTDLEEEHDEDRLRELCLCSGQETDAECTDGGNGHEEVLVKGFPMHHTLYCLFQCVMSDEQVGDKIYQQQLPGRQVAVFLKDDGCHQKDGG